MLMNTIFAKRHNVARNGRHTYHRHSNYLYRFCVSARNQATHQAGCAFCRQFSSCRWPGCDCSDVSAYLDQQNMTLRSTLNCAVRRGKPGWLLSVLTLFSIVDATCLAGQCLCSTQEEVQRSPVLARLQADGASGTVPLPLPLKIVNLWKQRVILGC